MRVRAIAPATLLTLACAVGLPAANPALDWSHLRLSGMDISSYQHGTSLDWTKVRAAGQDFAFVKATEGTGYTNPFFAADWASLAQVGMARGAYHFARPTQLPGSAAAQAQYFVKVAGLAQEPGALAPVLDLEVSGGLTPTQLVAWAKTWLGTVQSMTGYVPTIYTYAYFWRTATADSHAFASYPLFLADYHDRTGTTAPLTGMPGGWATWTFWQYDDTGSVPGIDSAVDLDRYNGPAISAATWGHTMPSAVAGPVLPLGTYCGQQLQLGSTGPAVAALQIALGAASDGAFGVLTAAALRRYQTAHGLPSTGITDAPTWTALVPPMPSPPTPPSAPPSPVPSPRQPAPPVVYSLRHYQGQLLRNGSSGPAVTALQHALHITADGQFGPITRNTLIAWQHAHGMSGTGVTDAATWTHLSPPSARPARPNPLIAYRAIRLQTGSTGLAVRALQQALHTTVDGEYGPQTQAAVTAYQRSRHLPATGNVTTLTWDALIHSS